MVRVLSPWAARPLFATMGAVVLILLSGTHPAQAASAARPSGASIREGLGTAPNPNLTPLLFSVDPAESAHVYATSQQYAVTNASSCGGALPAAQGGCCLSSLSDGACDDHDPAVTGCADASSYTVETANITDPTGAVIGYVEVRYSPTCKTNWGRVTGFGAYATAVKQTTACRGTSGQYPDSGCTDTDTGVEATRFSDQLYAPTECVSVVGVLVQPAVQGGGQFTATTPPAC
jgi:Protein of unknown function (DUF2690)